MGSASGFGVDVDTEALSVAAQNFSKLDITNVELVLSDVQTLSISGGENTANIIYAIILLCSN